MRRLAPYALLLLALATTACQFNPYASQFTRTRPAEAALAGKYTVTRETIEWVQRERNYDVSGSRPYTLCRRLGFGRESLRHGRRTGSRLAIRCWSLAPRSLSRMVVALRSSPRWSPAVRRASNFVLCTSSAKSRPTPCTLPWATLTPGGPCSSKGSSRCARARRDSRRLPATRSRP